ncbi:uncharacterized protein [Elaeis guineensis]|nr:uncharacterized protein LOC105035066 isoform X2 [Elaeis guineensis]
MENQPRRFSTIGKLFAESTADTKSRFWQASDLPSPEAAVICPEPHRAIAVACVIDNLNRFSSKSNDILPVHKGDYSQEILDIILSKDDREGDSDASNQVFFFSGSPPARTNNPIVRDAQFLNQTTSLAPPWAHHHGIRPSAKVERGSPSCGSSFGGSPKVRIKGFACSAFA